MSRTAAPPPPASYAVHWFRRDLRTAGNPALQSAWKEFGGRVLGFFCFDTKFLARPDFSANRFALFLATLRTLRDELRSLGGDLLVLDVGPQEAFGRLFAKLRERNLTLPQRVAFNRDYEPFARARDTAMTDLLFHKYGVDVQTERDHLLIEPEEILRDGKAGQFYQVYTPFSRRWFERLQTTEVQSRIRAQQKPLQAVAARAKGKFDAATFQLTWPTLFGGAVPLEDQLEKYLAQNQSRVTVSIPPVGTAAAIERLQLFGKRALTEYAERRDLPSVDGTSQVSLYLKNGTITTAQVLAALDLDDSRLDGNKKPDGRTTYVKEIAWREFYYHILYHRPDVESGAFLERYRDLEWENREDYFEAWKAGRTGYPIVDAGMRQLRETGWMHNRVRMIVASFLTKDLLIDWRWGERYFMEALLDGDLAPNNGGWQWAASTGCDPQPYFRIFNPKLQGEKFDPDGEYVRRWVPELRGASTKVIHEPHASSEAKGYPKPIVEHAAQKAKALALYSSGG
jgi:deoxyribodipyrimidine photo-lyase